MTRKISLIIAFLIIVFDLNGQIQLNNRSLIQPDLNLLYSGRVNEIAIHNSISNRVYTLKSAHSQLTKISDTLYKITPAFHIGTDTLTVFENGIEIHKSIYRILNMPISTIQIGSITPMEKKVSIDRILENPQLLLIANSLYLETETIVTFDFNIYSPSGPNPTVYSSESNKGSKFSAEQIEAIKQLNAGDRLEITRIIVMDSKGNKFMNRGCSLVIQ